MLAFDLTELKNFGVDIGPLPDERGRLIEARFLPAEFADYLRRDGFDTSKPIRVVGIIARRADGGPGRYSIHFEQAYGPGGE
jgi:ribulose bisphosphate carboxylase small subunit